MVFTTMAAMLAKSMYQRDDVEDHEEKVFV